MPSWKTDRNLLQWLHALRTYALRSGASTDIRAAEVGPVPPDLGRVVCGETSSFEYARAKKFCAIIAALDEMSGLVSCPASSCASRLTFGRRSMLRPGPCALEGGGGAQYQAVGRAFADDL